MEQSLMDTRFFIHVPGDQPSSGQRPWVHEVHRTAVSSATAGNNAHARHWVHKVKFQLVGTIHFFKHMIYYYFFNCNLLFWQRFAAALLPRLFWTNLAKSQVTPQGRHPGPGPVWFELATNGIQLYDIANLDKHYICIEFNTLSPFA